jgi:copper resistance protein C
MKALLLTAALVAALFHLKLERSLPAKDAVVTAPRELSLWYSQTPNMAGTRVTLTGPNGPVPTGKPTLASAPKSPVVVPITGAMPVGKYIVNWVTASSDGHPIKGSYGFTVK